MSLNLFNYNSSLFSGMSSNSSGMSSMLGDYMAIRNGSYGKLLKAYYSQDDGVKKSAGALRKDSTKKKLEALADSEEVKKYKSTQTDADSLKSAAGSLRSSSKLFEKVSKTTIDDNGEEKTTVLSKIIRNLINVW